jgi:hypothetical protein
VTDPTDAFAALRDHHRPPPSPEVRQAVVRAGRRRRGTYAAASGCGLLAAVLVAVALLPGAPARPDSLEVAEVPTASPVPTPSREAAASEPSPAVAAAPPGAVGGPLLGPAAVAGPSRSAAPRPPDRRTQGARGPGRYEPLTRVFEPGGAPDTCQAENKGIVRPLLGSAREDRDGCEESRADLLSSGSYALSYRACAPRLAQSQRLELDPDRFDWHIERRAVDDPSDDVERDTEDYLWRWRPRGPQESEVVTLRPGDCVRFTTTWHRVDDRGRRWPAVSQQDAWMEVADTFVGRVTFEVR